MEVGVVAELLKCLPSIQTTLPSPQHCIKQTGAHACLHSDLSHLRQHSRLEAVFRWLKPYFKNTRTRQQPLHSCIIPTCVAFGYESAKFR